jgi:hypothetical protein|tara:strand:- start:26 stop:154 length:129 start_codon:yes stop_codon:yes gene_type:complete
MLIALFGGRDLTKAYDYGHVDMPRLKIGNKLLSIMYEVKVTL